MARVSKAAPARGPVPAGVDVGDGAAYVTVGDVVWKVALLRRPVQKDLPERFDPLGDASLNTTAEPFSVGAEPARAVSGLTRPLERGEAEFGLQTDDEVEYFFSKGGGLVGRLLLRRRDGDSWGATVAKTNLPSVLSKEAVGGGLVPPLGHSALPASLERVVPPEYRYWEAETPEQAARVRDALVESGFLAEDAIKVVDGELRKVEVRYFLYEPEGGAEPREVELAEPRTAEEKVLEQCPPGLTPSTPCAYEEGTALREAVAREDCSERLFLLSPTDPGPVADLIELTKFVSEGQWLIECDDTDENRAALAELGPTYKVRGEDRLLCSSFAPARPELVELVKATWTTAFVNDLPDSSFLHIMPGGKKDAEGKTTPRSLRKFPVKDADGEVDLPHLRDALARIPQASGLSRGQKDALQARARRMLENAQKSVRQLKETGSFAPDTLGHTPAGSPVPLPAAEVPLAKPFAGFRDFDACLAAQRGAGRSEEAARAICGALMRDTEGKASPALSVKHVLKAGSGEQPEERYVFGIVLEPEPFGGEGDAQHDVYDEATVEKAQRAYMEEFQNVGLMHRGVVNDKVRILESYLAPCDIRVGEHDVKKGTWLMGCRILDDELWRAVKAGELTGFSIGGTAVREPEAA